jgi:hypothetical protein
MNKLFAAVHESLLAQSGHCSCIAIFPLMTHVGEQVPSSFVPAHTRYLAAMCSAMKAASLPTPASNAELTAYVRLKPRK